MSFMSSSWKAVHDVGQGKLVICFKIMFLILTAAVGLAVTLAAWIYYYRIEDAESLITPKCYSNINHPKELEKFCLNVKVWQTIAILSIGVGFFHVIFSIITLVVTLKYQICKSNLYNEIEESWQTHIATDGFVIWFAYKLIAEHFLTFILAILLANRAESVSGPGLGLDFGSGPMERLAFVIASEFVLIICMSVVVALFVVELIVAMLFAVIYVMDLKG